MNYVYTIDGKPATVEEVDAFFLNEYGMDPGKGVKTSSFMAAHAAEMIRMGLKPTIWANGRVTCEPDVTK